MNSDKVFWESVCVPYDEIIEQKDKHISRCKISLTQLSPAYLSSLNSAFFNVTLTGENETNISRICDSNKIIEYILIKEFYRGRKNLVDEFFKSPYFSRTISEGDWLVPYLPLLKAYQEDKKNLEKSLVYCEYKKKVQKDVFLISPEWKAEDNAKFITSFHSLKIKVSRKYKGKKFVNLINFSDGSSQYYFFQRQKKQRVARAFTKNVPLTGRSDLFIRINEDGKKLEIRCTDSSLRNTIANHMQKVCEKKLVYENSRPLSFNLNEKILQILTQIPKEVLVNQIVVEQAHIRKTAVTVKNKLKVGQKNGADVRITLDKIHELGLSDLADFKNIASFHINYQGFSIGIKLVEENNSVKFLLTKSDISDGNLEEIKSAIEEQFGIKIGITYSSPLNTNAQEKLFQRYLDFDGRRYLSEPEKTFLEKMGHDGIINTTTEEVWRCIDETKHFFPKRYDHCPNCGGELFLLRDYQGSKPNIKGITEFVKRILIQKFGKDNIKKKKRIYRKVEYLFFVAQEGSSSLHFYIDDGKKSLKSVIKYFLKSSIPTVIISIEKPVKGEIDGSVFSNIFLKDLYFSDSGSIISQSVNELKRNHISRIDAHARNSSERIKRMLQQRANYESSDLEDDVFNILKYIFRTGEKWGKEKSGSTVPEGVIGYSTYYKKRKKGYKQGKSSFIWDCKYHSKEGTFDFSRAEKDKARRYIKQANDSTSIKKFSGKLNAYVNFCNAVNLTQYDNFSKALYRIKSWDGSVVLFDLDALIELYEFFKNNEALLLTKFKVFLSQFSKMIERPKNEKFVQINYEKIKELTESITKISLPNDLDVESLTETFERDEID
ncbi:hypothetical protein HOC96_02055 [archaeon]|nr:hypothetical protein [archaeon]